MSEYARAPWTPEQVKNLNDYQICGSMHPYTCRGDRGDAAHVKYAREHHQDNGQLMATTVGWICPICGYQQDWALGWMADGSWRASDQETKKWIDRELQADVPKEFTLAAFGGSSVFPVQKKIMTQNEAWKLNQTEMEGTGTMWFPSEDVDLEDPEEDL